MSENLSSPLTEVEKESLSDLFAKDPLKLDRKDIDRICAELRAQRAKWASEDHEKPKKKEKATLTEGQMNDLLDGITL